MRLRRRITISLERRDAHAADLPKQLTVEVAARARLSDIVAHEIEPFLAGAPRARWVCRLVMGASYEDVAEVVTLHTSAAETSRLFVPDARIGALLAPGSRECVIACRDL